MAEGITLKRIIDMDEATELTSSDYALVDSATGGPKKFALGDELSSLKEDLDDVETALETKAEIDGYYEEMTVGNAEQLVSTVYEEDSVPYIFRTAGGSMDIGDREEDMLVGGTVVLNQLVQNGNFEAENGWIPDKGTVSVSNNELTYTVTTVDSQYYYGNQVRRFNLAVPNNHVVLLHAETYAPYSNGFYMSVRTNSVGQSGVGISNVSITPNAWNSLYKVTKLTNQCTDITFYWSMDTNYTVGDSVKLRNVMMVDLTLMFGVTIADYIYSLEQANAGAGVAWFRKLFPKDYYAYNAGSMLHVEGVSAHATTGFNQWDEQWEVGCLSSGVPSFASNAIRSKNYCPCIGGATYYMTCGKTDGGTDNRYYIAMAFYDADKKYIKAVYNNNATVVAPDNAMYFKITTNTSTVIYGATYNHDICINFHWDGERDGEYESYVKRSYPLDSSLTLRGIPKLDSANNLYYDGDTYESDGTVTRRYNYLEYDGSSDENWILQSINSSGIANFSISIPYYDTTPTSGFNNISNRFGRQTSLIGNTTTEGYMLAGGGTLYIRIASTKADTVAAFRTWLASNPTAFVYMLATPTTETAEPYQNPQIVDDFGTEEYVTTSIVPVGHVTKYQPNLRAKLEMSPDSPDGDGDYIVRQADGENSYVSLASTATIQDILARLTALEGNTNEG